MKHHLHIYGVFLVLFLAVSLLRAETPQKGTSNASGDLQRDISAYRRLPAGARQRMKQLDEDLQSADPATKTRMLKVMNRFQEWIERLPETDRNYLESAADAKEKLERVREIRERQWLATLPKTDRERVSAAPSTEERNQIIAGLRKRDEDRKMDWHMAEVRQEEREEFNRWRTQEMARWIQRELQPKLTDAEKKQLQRTAFRGQTYLSTVIELAKKHEVALPGPLQKYRPRPMRRSSPAVAE